MMSKKWYNCPSCGKRCWVYSFFPQTPCLECLGSGGGGGGSDDSAAAAAAAEAERKRERERAAERERQRERERERARQREREEREERERLRREREAEEAREREEARKLEEERKRKEEEEAKKKHYQAATPEFKRWLTQEARMAQYLSNFEAAGAADEGFIPDLDDDMLKEVIGIDNPIHRRRLMRVVAAYAPYPSVSGDDEDPYAPYEPPSMPPPPKSYASSRSVTSSARPVERCATCCHYHVEARPCSMCSELSGAAAQEEADARPEEHIIFNIASSGKECPKPRQSAKSIHTLRERCKACLGSLELEALVRVIWQEFGDYVAEVDGPCLKGEQRTREKLDAEYNGDHTKLLDLCRLRVRAKRLRTVASIFYALQNHEQLQGLEVVYVKNRFADPSATGHRDMALVLHHRQLDVLVELQLAWEALAKGQKKSHVTYERIREKEAEVELDKRKLAEQQQRIFDEQDTVFSPKRKKGRAAFA